MDKEPRLTLGQRLQMTANYVAMVLQPQDELLRAAMAAYEESLRPLYLHKAA